MIAKEKRRRGVIGPLLAVLLVACKPEHVVGAPDDAATPAAPATPDAACGALYDAVAASAGCASIPTYYGSPARFVQHCERVLASPGAGGAADAIQRCATAIRTAAVDCSVLDGDACIAPAGMLPAGAACGSALQCASGYCVGPAGNTAEVASLLYLGAHASMTSCGVCADRIAFGQPCTTSLPQCGAACNVLPVPCVDHAVCTDTAIPGPPTVQRMATCLATTQTTDRAGEGASCANRPCGVGLRCDRTGACVRASSVGEGCGNTGDCVDRLVCVANRCADGKGLRQKCVLAADGTSDCIRGTACDAPSQTCIAISRAAPGAPCDGIHARCETGNCNVTSPGSAGSPPSGTCPEVVSDGKSCEGLGSNMTCGAFATCAAPTPPNGCCATGTGTTGGGGGPSIQDAGAPGPPAVRTCVLLDPSSCK